jgi:hypothetical protein
MDFIRSKCCKWHCIIRLGIYPSRNPPTNSFEEATVLTRFAPRLIPGQRFPPLNDPITALGAHFNNIRCSVAPFRRNQSGSRSPKGSNTTPPSTV